MQEAAPGTERHCNTAPFVSAGGSQSLRPDPGRHGKLCRKALRRLQILTIGDDRWRDVTRYPEPVSYTHLVGQVLFVDGGCNKNCLPEKKEL